MIPFAPPLLGVPAALLPSEPEFPAEHLRHKPLVDDQRADTLAHLFVPTNILWQIVTDDLAPLIVERALETY